MDVAPALALASLTRGADSRITRVGAGRQGRRYIHDLKGLGRHDRGTGELFLGLTGGLREQFARQLLLVHIGERQVKKHRDPCVSSWLID